MRQLGVLATAARGLQQGPGFAWLHMLHHVAKVEAALMLHDHACLGAH